MNKIQNILLNAFNTGCLVATFIDLQMEQFYDGYCTFGDEFENAARLSNDFQQKGIETIWLAMTSDSRMQKVSVKEFLLSCKPEEVFCIVTPPEEAFVFNKNRMSGFINPYLKNHLSDNKVQILSGVFSTRCIDAYLHDLFAWQPDSTVILAVDAIDGIADDPQRYIARYKTNNLHYLPVNEIIRSIPELHLPSPL